MVHLTCHRVVTLTVLLAAYAHAAGSDYHIGIGEYT